MNFNKIINNQIYKRYTLQTFDEQIIKTERIVLLAVLMLQFHMSGV